jgi:hypothetical protein
MELYFTLRKVPLAGKKFLRFCFWYQLPRFNAATLRHRKRGNHRNQRFRPSCSASDVRLGVKPVINGQGTYTTLGGSLMPTEVLTAMAEAAGSFVSIPELQEKVGVPGTPYLIPGDPEFRRDAEAAGNLPASLIDVNHCNKMICNTESGGGGNCTRRRCSATSFPAT